MYILRPDQIIEVHLITTRTPDYIYIHELTVTAQQQQ
jgi:hypothetical protein